MLGDLVPLVYLYQVDSTSTHISMLAATVTRQKKTLTMTINILTINVTI